MNDKGDTRDDLRIPEGELGQKVKDEFTKEDNTVIVSGFFNCNSHNCQVLYDKFKYNVTVHLSKSNLANMPLLSN